MVAFSVLFIVINDYLLVTRGPTVAKWMLGIRIVDYATGGDSPLVKVPGARYIVFLALQSIPIIGGLIGLVDILFLRR